MNRPIERNACRSLCEKKTFIFRLIHLNQYTSFIKSKRKEMKKKYAFTLLVENRVLKEKQSKIFHFVFEKQMFVDCFLLSMFYVLTKAWAGILFCNRTKTTESFYDFGVLIFRFSYLYFQFVEDLASFRVIPTVFDQASVTKQSFSMLKIRRITVFNDSQFWIFKIHAGFVRKLYNHLIFVCIVFILILLRRVLLSICLCWFRCFQILKWELNKKFPDYKREIFTKTCWSVALVSIIWSAIMKTLKIWWALFDFNVKLNCAKYFTQLAFQHM